MCIDALNLVPNKNGLLGEVVRIMRPDSRAVITAWERRGNEVKDLPPEYSITDVGSLLEGAGLRVLVREECDDWLKLQKTFFQHTIAEDNDDAEPALHSLAMEGRDFLTIAAYVRRLLLVASV